MGHTAPVRTLGSVWGHLWCHGGMLLALSGWIQPPKEDDLAQMSAQTEKPHTKMTF